MAWLPILVPPAGSPHAHLPFRISLSSVSLGLQLSLVESQVREDPRRRRRHPCVDVAVHAEIRLLVRLTSFFGDRFVLYFVSCMECDLVRNISIYDQGGLHNLNVYDISILRPASAVLMRICAISSIKFYKSLSNM